jgi:hypothetical protein
MLAGSTQRRQLRPRPRRSLFRLETKCLSKETLFPYLDHLLVDSRPTVCSSTLHVSGIALSFFPWSWKLLSLTPSSSSRDRQQILCCVHRIVIAFSHRQRYRLSDKRSLFTCATGDAQCRYMDGDRSHHSRVAGRDPIPSISESILHRTPACSHLHTARVYITPTKWSSGS